MKRIFVKLQEIWSILELRERVIFTVLLLAAYRLGNYLVLPGVNPVALEAASGSNTTGLLGLINAFTGGSFLKASVLALGIMPYISASIIIQLLGFAVPYFQKLQKEGESGQRKLNQYTRILTIGVALLQSVGYLTYLTNAFQGAIAMDSFLRVTNIFVLTAGTVFCMWLGERITDRGIGNGVSLLIAIGIMASLPGALQSELASRVGGATGGLILFVVELAVLVLVTIFTIALVQAVRRIPLQFARSMVQRGQRVAPGEGERQYLPIKLNASGVMPIIFAQAIMFLPAALANYASASGQASGFFATLQDFKSLPYNLIYFLLIIVFTFVYTALIVDPAQQSEFLKRQNAFIPGVKPGEETAEYIDNVASRVTLPGGVALAVVAILPAIAGLMGIQDVFAVFFGGTSLIIMVGVVLDTLQQIETYLLKSQYDSLIQGTRIKGRNDAIGSEL